MTNITSTFNSTDAIVEAWVFRTTDGFALLNFKDGHGVSRISLHGVPVAVAEATAEAFNAALAEHNREPEPVDPEAVEARAEQYLRQMFEAGRGDLVGD